MNIKILSGCLKWCCWYCFENQLLSDPLQFGFKQTSSCSHALFTFKTVVDHYVKCGSTVTVCALNIYRKHSIKLITMLYCKY